MRVVVTGANGHIGSNIVRVLIEQGHSVVALVRPRADRRALDGLAVDVREGDILDRESLAAAFDGADVVIHAAAPHRNFASDPNELIRPAVDGTRNVLDACAKAKVRRMVLTSSAATVGFATQSTQPLDERHQIGAANAPRGGRSERLARRARTRRSRARCSTTRGAGISPATRRSPGSSSP
ncbi:MAG TPA: NAD-dependent epimerase/dehydratase family protein [Kofleriaceae bacterium]|nr:NAD-dependent epimerase/dehydratase family protein [Kofleriaceae bacterium]